MTDNVLKRAYLKAKENGYKCKWSDLEFALEKNIILFNLEQSFYSYWIDKYGHKINTKWFSIFDIIINHDFAKTFWGEKAEETQIMRYSEFINNRHGIKSWQYHLQQMVLEKEPLKYLDKFLKD